MSKCVECVEKNCPECVPKGYNGLVLPPVERIYYGQIWVIWHRTDGHGNIGMVI